MRLRNIPAAAQAVAESPYVIQEASLPGLRQLPGPFQVEIGMGKGQFLFEMSRRHPQIQYIGIERHTSVLYRAVQKMDLYGEDAPQNLSFICADASCVDTMFLPGCVDRIYLNFSDPWPKKRHANRRLTSRQYLARYRAVLSESGEIEIKTDNTGLFDFTLEELSACGWSIRVLTRDLHHDPVLFRDNCMTEYEEKFSALGHPICKVIASPGQIPS